jgi:hypothetical protein
MTKNGITIIISARDAIDIPIATFSNNTLCESPEDVKPVRLLVAVDDVQ